MHLVQAQKLVLVEPVVVEAGDVADECRREVARRRRRGGVPPTTSATAAATCGDERDESRRRHQDAERACPRSQDVPSCSPHGLTGRSYCLRPPLTRGNYSLVAYEWYWLSSTSTRRGLEPS